MQQEAASIQARAERGASWQSRLAIKVLRRSPRAQGISSLERAASLTTEVIQRRSLDICIVSYVSSPVSQIRWLHDMNCFVVWFIACHWGLSMTSA